MSYCRFSSMNWACDVYTYESTCGGFVTHVASRRHVFQPIPSIIYVAFNFLKPGKNLSFTQNLICRFVTFWEKWVHLGSLRLIPKKPIGLKYDGECFVDLTADDCADRLEMLRDAGYRVPLYAIEDLREDGKNSS